MYTPLAITLILLLLAGCTTDHATDRSCRRCHGAIEHPSPSHPGCVTCHGGNPNGWGKGEAHRGLLGGRNPSSPAVWERSCGRCHDYQLRRVASGIMHTNAGFIRNTRLNWGDEDRLVTTDGSPAFDERGRAVTPGRIADVESLGGELYRKYCARCHVGTENGESYGASHAGGCAACHFPFGDDATYRGSDPLLYGATPAARSHRMEPLPGIDVCTRCHNRSGRVALSYQGILDGNNGYVPTRGGELGPVPLSGGRNGVHIMPDIHFARGMECIDCHTSREVMGDGYLYRNMYRQTETGCADCHGTGTRRPAAVPILQEHGDPLRESRRYRVPMTAGTHAVLTRTGRPYSNVREEGGRIMLITKRGGKILASPVISGRPDHTIVGHERLSCHACHSRTVIQCYGCHTTYDRSQEGYDVIRGETSPGLFSETEDYRMLYPFPLALDQRGEISPVTPGCQTFVTTIDESKTVTMEDAVLPFRGKRQLRFAPFFSHNVGKRAIGCRECHGNPRFFGFGQGVAEGGTIVPTLLCEKNRNKPLDGFVTLGRGGVTPFAAITREGSRPLTTGEIRRVFRVNLCLPCHDRGDDPIYQRRLDYRALRDSLHTRLLGDDPPRRTP